MKIGVVGYGSIGKRHAANLRGLGHNVLVYDPTIVGGSDVRFERNIYETCEAVVIATPTIAHEAPLRACIERGKHALVEKPISAAEGALAELLQVADEKKLVVMMGNNLHFHGCVQQARLWLQQGKISRPLWANFICAQFNERYINDSVVLNWGAHEVNLALYLFGPVQSVISANVTKDERIADFVLQHLSGTRSSFHLDYITPNEIREAWIVGEDANIGIDLVGRTISLGGTVERMPGSFDQDYIDEAKAFVDKIEGRPAIGADGWQGLVTLKVLIDVRKKAGLL